MLLQLSIAEKHQEEQLRLHFQLAALETRRSSNAEKEVPEQGAASPGKAEKQRVKLEEETVRALEPLRR